MSSHGLRVCSECREPKPPSAFYKGQHRCKECSNARCRKTREGYARYVSPMEKFEPLLQAWCLRRLPE